jgi:hypothetical protein
MAHIVLEQSFEQPISDDTYQDFAARLDPCLEVRNGAWLRSYVALDRRRMVCEFEAPDAESVREALRAAGVPFDRVWTAERYAVEDYPPMLEKLEQLRRRSQAESGR